MPAAAEPSDELTLLRSLIAQVGTASRSGSLKDLAPALDAVAQRTWSEEEHRIVYESLRASARNHAAPIPLRQQMAAAATRLGHPDVDWDLYF